MDLTIVHDATTSAIAQQVNAIISTISECESRIFTEKNWNDNKAMISSENYVLFIGNVPDGVALKPIIKWKYENINMKYGWIGKKALMIVEKHIFEKEEFEELKEVFENKKLNKINTRTKMTILGVLASFIGFCGGGIASNTFKNDESEKISNWLVLAGGLVGIASSSIALWFIKKNTDKIYQAEYEYMINLLFGKRIMDFYDFIGKNKDNEN